MNNNQIKDLPASEKGSKILLKKKKVKRLPKVVIKFTEDNVDYFIEFHY